MNKEKGRLGLTRKAQGWAEQPQVCMFARAPSDKGFLSLVPVLAPSAGCGREQRQSVEPSHHQAPIILSTGY